MVTAVVKRAGHNEPYGESKLHRSIERACREARVFEGEAELIAARVARSVSEWAASKAEVTSRDIAERTLAAIGPYHPAAAFAYGSHDSVL